MAAPRSLVINVQQDLDPNLSSAEELGQAMNPILAKVVESTQLDGTMLVGGHTKFGLDFSKSSAA